MHSTIKYTQRKKIGLLIERVVKYRAKLRFENSKAQKENASTDISLTSAAGKQ
jgi:hypothetical protein